jgi:hypothetical protein
MAFQLSDLWRWDGAVSRRKYAAVGVICFAIKYQLDRLLSWTVFHRDWPLRNYILPDVWLDLPHLPAAERGYYFWMLFAATPFIWIGAVMTARRLYDADMPTWLVGVYFLPAINWLMIALLLVAPTSPPLDLAEQASEDDSIRRRSLDGWIPESRFGSALLALVINGIVGLLLVWLSTESHNFYGWGVFVGLPFCLGLSASLIYGYPHPRSMMEMLAVANLSVLLVAGLLLAVAMEGILCILMAFPLWLLSANLGGLVGFAIHDGAARSSARMLSIPCLLVVMPGEIVWEAKVCPPKPLFAVTTTIEVNAAPSEVFQNVVSFRELPPPTEWLFAAGIAYPVRAEIVGHGVGAKRQCVFSTGPFVEPITAWEEPTSLQFAVESCPAPMQEWSFYAQIQPPHLHGFLNSKRGEFRLEPLADGRTRLSGTTWYEHSMWPAEYWRIWSDTMLHTIHLRVLNHVKTLAEQGRQS